MLLRVISEGPDSPLEASLDHGNGGESHTGATLTLVFHGTNIAEFDGVVGIWHILSVVSVGVEELLRPLVNREVVVISQPGVGPDELAVRDVAELVDGVIPGLVPGDVGLVCLQDLLLVLV